MAVRYACGDGKAWVKKVESKQQNSVLGENVVPTLSSKSRKVYKRLTPKPSSQTVAQASGPPPVLSQVTLVATPSMIACEESGEKKFPTPPPPPPPPPVPGAGGGGPGGNPAPMVAGVEQPPIVGAAVVGNVQQTGVLDVRRLWFCPSRTQRECLARTLNCEIKDLIVDSIIPHAHGVTAHEKRVLESAAYKFLVEAGCKSVRVEGGTGRDCPFQDRWFHCPAVTPSAVVSAVKRPAADRSCVHEIGCDCVSTGDGCLWVHGIYGKTPEQVARALMHAGKHVGVSVMHLYAGDRGVKSGEMTWTRVGDSIITGVQNPEGYVTTTHATANTDWIIVQRSVRTDFGYLVWDIHRTFGSTELVVFTVVEFDVAPVIQAQPFDVALQSDHYYGEVSPFVPRYEKARQVNSSFVECPIYSYDTYSFGKWFMLWPKKPETGKKVLVPKLLVAKLGDKMVFAHRNKVTFDSLLLKAKTVKDDYTHDTNVSERVLAMAVALAFTRSINDEIAILESVVRPYMEAGWLGGSTAQLHSNMLDHKYPLQKKWVAIGGGMIGVATAAVGMWKKAPKFMIGGAIASAACVASIAALAKIAPREEVLPNISKKKSSVPQVPYGSQLMDQRDATDGPKRSVSIVGPVVKTAVPVAMDPNSVENERVAYSNRLCVELPDMSKLSGPCLDLFKFVEKFFEQLFPKAERSLNPLSHEKYAEGLTSSKRKEYMANLKKYGDEMWAPSAIAKMQLRVKDETHVKIGVDHEECRAPVKPRAIFPNDPRYTIKTARWCKAISNLLRKVWSGKHFLHYAAGSSGEDLAAVFSGHAGKFLAQDFSSFDGTVHEFLQLLELYCYRRFGVPPHVLKYMLAGMRVRGRTARGQKFNAGYRRGSGRHNTSVGNSLLNGLVTAFAIWTLMGKPEKLDFEQVIAVAGDDTLAKVPEQVLSAHLSQVMAALGLKSKCFVCPDLWHAEILSCVPVPVKSYVHDYAGASYVLDYVFSPKPFKFIAKIGTTVNPLIAQKLKSGDAARYAREHYSGVCLGAQVAMHPHPVLGAYVDRMAGETKVAVVEPYRLTHTVVHEPSVGAEAVFAGKYGFTPAGIRSLSQFKYVRGIVENEAFVAGLEVDLQPPARYERDVPLTLVFSECTPDDLRTVLMG